MIIPFHDEQPISKLNHLTKVMQQVRAGGRAQTQACLTMQSSPLTTLLYSTAFVNHYATLALFRFLRRYFCVWSDSKKSIQQMLLFFNSTFSIYGVLEMGKIFNGHIKNCEEESGKEKHMK